MLRVRKQRLPIKTKNRVEIQTARPEKADNEVTDVEAPVVEMIAQIEAKEESVQLEIKIGVKKEVTLVAVIEQSAARQELPGLSNRVKAGVVPALVVKAAETASQERMDLVSNANSVKLGSKN